jgi:cell division protein FtsL
MSRVLVLNKSSARVSQDRAQRSAVSASGVFAMNSKLVRAGKAQINLISLVFMMVVCVCISGACYLYQVNDIATKGYEVRDLENRIQDLNKESKKMEINEVELRSMYNIEKASQDLNLVNASEVTYVEINGPVAMK